MITSKAPSLKVQDQFAELVSSLSTSANHLEDCKTVIKDRSKQMSKLKHKRVELYLKVNKLVAKDLLKNIRVAAGLTLQDFANKLKLTGQYICNLESGRQTAPHKILQAYVDLLEDIDKNFMRDESTGESLNKGKKKPVKKFVKK